MKAADILKSINTRYCTDSVIAKIKKAIAELESLENRSCNNCKYKSKNECTAKFIIVCKRHPRLPDHYEESK